MLWLAVTCRVWLYILIYVIVEDLLKDNFGFKLRKIFLDILVFCSQPIFPKVLRDYQRKLFTRQTELEYRLKQILKTFPESYLVAIFVCVMWGKWPSFLLDENFCWMKTNLVTNLTSNYSLMIINEWKLHRGGIFCPKLVYKRDLEMQCVRYNQNYPIITCLLKILHRSFVNETLGWLEISYFQNLSIFPFIF